MKVSAFGPVLPPSFVAIAISVRKLIVFHLASLKVFNCVSCLSKVTFRFPSCLFISLLLDPVLHPVLLDLLVKDCFDFVFFRPSIMSSNGLFWSCCLGKGSVAALLRTLLLNTRWIWVYGESSSLYKLCPTFYFTRKGPQYLSLRLALRRFFLVPRPLT